MKKRICTAVVIITVCGLLIGCGKQSYSNSTTKNNVETKTEVSSNEKNKLNITKGTGFHGGVAVVTTADEKKIAIDQKGNKLFDVDTKNNSDILFFDGVASMGDNLIDKKGNIIASPEKNGYTGLCSPYCNGYALAYYFEEAYPNSIIKVGVLNRKGEWTVPLSESNKIITELKKSEGEWFAGANINNIAELFESIQRIGVLIETVDSENVIHIGTYVGNGSRFIQCYENGIFLINLDSDSTENFCYDAKSDKILYKLDKTEKAESRYIKYLKSGTEDMKEKEEELGTSFEVYGDGYYTKHMVNDAGTGFFCVYNEKGKEMFKPIKSESANLKSEYNCICIDKEGYVIENEIENTFSYYDISGKKIITYENVDEMDPFYEGLSKVTYKDHVRYIDKSGKTMIE